MTSALEDKVLFDLVRKKDKDSFDQLFRRWYPILVAYAIQFVSQEDAENVVQDLMFSIWENASSISLRNSLSTYLHRATKNRCLNLLSQSETHDRYISAVRLSIIDSVSDSQMYSVNEIISLLKKALDELPEVQRTAYEMNRFHGLSFSKIAELTDVSVSTVEYRVSQALKRIRASLIDYLPLTLITLLLGKIV